MLAINHKISDKTATGSPRALAGSCVDLLTQMIGFDTVNHRACGQVGAEVALALWLEQLADAWGLKTQRLVIDDDEFNLLVYVEVDPTKPWLLFDSHLDTVTVEGMTIDPFVAKISEGRTDQIDRVGRIYGRGACDTKGSGAAMLWALKRYANQGNLKNNVAILFNVDEERGKSGVSAFVETQMPNLGWRPAAVIVGEPTEMQIVSATGGVVRWCIRTRGIGAHSSNPAQGKSAIHAMVKVIDALERQYIAKLSATHPMIGKAQCSINMICGGTQINVIPEVCEIQIDRRLVPGESASQILPEVEKVLEALRACDKNLDVEQDTPFTDPPLDPCLSASLVSGASVVLGRYGLSDPPTGVAYGTNASAYAQAGIPSIVLGPGNIEQAHSADEWLSLEQLHLSEQIYFDLMMDACEICR